MFRIFLFILFWKIPRFGCFYFQCILVVFAIAAMSNAIPIEFGHYASPVYAPVAKAILPEPIVSVWVLYPINSLVSKIIFLRSYCILEWRVTILIILHSIASDRFIDKITSLLYETRNNSWSYCVCLFAFSRWQIFEEKLSKNQIILIRKLNSSNL